MRIVAISDVHTKWKELKIPECDVLISAGDYSYRGESEIVEAFHAWLYKQPANNIISVQGNHELWVERNFEKAKEIAERVCPGVHFIEEGPIEINGVKFWCSAFTPWFYDWAYNVQRGSEIDEHWKKIPEDTNILITHGPPFDVLDVVYFPDGTPKDNVGCWNLKARIKQIKPDIHIFGHIHNSHGQKHEDGISYFNVCICDEMYIPSNPITVIDYERK